MVRTNENDLAIIAQLGYKLVGWLVGRSDSRSVGWLVPSLVGCLVGWLVGHSWLDEND